jgi:hypothetical protein
MFGKIQTFLEELLTFSKNFTKVVWKVNRKVEK